MRGNDSLQPKHFLSSTIRCPKCLAAASATPRLLHGLCSAATAPSNYYPENQSKEGALLLFCSSVARFPRKSESQLLLQAELVFGYSHYKEKALLGSVLTFSRRRTEQARTSSGCPSRKRHPKPAARDFTLLPTHGVTLAALHRSFPTASQQPEYFICSRALQGSSLSGIIPSVRHCPGTPPAQALPALKQAGNSLPSEISTFPFLQSTSHSQKLGTTFVSSLSLPPAEEMPS